MAEHLAVWYGDAWVCQCGQELTSDQAADVHTNGVNPTQDNSRLVTAMWSMETRRADDAYARN